MASLGLQAEGPAIDDPIQKVRVQFFAGPGPRIELIEPLAPDAPVSGMLKRGTRLYHLAYMAADFDACRADLEQAGYRAVAPPAPAAAFDMKRIVFMMSPTALLVEIIEAPDVRRPA